MVLPTTTTTTTTIGTVLKAMNQKFTEDQLKKIVAQFDADGNLLPSVFAYASHHHITTYLTLLTTVCHFALNR
jgi:hypothetical protein